VQPRAHLDYHVKQEPRAILLVLTPRPSDARIVECLNDERLLFLSWQEIANYLKHASQGNSSGAMIVRQFLEYAQEAKEFMSSELEKKDIDAFIEYMASRPDEKIQGAFELLGAKFEFKDLVSLSQPPYWNDAWGRKGIDMQLPTEKYSRWLSFGIYYDTEDHGIPFLAGCPELALFVDIHPKERERLRNNSLFVESLARLEKLGWEENLSNTRTDNEWRLLWWRKPLSEFSVLTVDMLQDVLAKRLSELKSEPEFAREYLNEGISNKKPPNQ
jgi:hypothetical protein